VVDQNLAPIVDKRHVYSGCWVIPTVIAKWFDVGTNKGPTFYLQSVMVVADDENLGGTGSANPNADFAGVKIDQTVNPAAAFGVEGPTAGAADHETVLVYRILEDGRRLLVLRYDVDGYDLRRDGGAAHRLRDAQRRRPQEGRRTIGTRKTPRPKCWCCPGGSKTARTSAGPGATTPQSSSR
jgi:hypothetical protein